MPPARFLTSDSAAPTRAGGVHLATGCALARWCLPLLPRVVPARYAVALRHGVVFGSVIPVRHSCGQVPARGAPRARAARCACYAPGAQTHFRVAAAQDFDLVLTAAVCAWTEDKVWIDRVRRRAPRGVGNRA